MKKISLLALVLPMFCLAGAFSKGSAAETNDKKTSGNAETADKSKEENAKGSPQHDTTTLTLPKLGLKIDVPGEATASDGMGDGSMMVLGTDVSVEVAPASDADPKTLKEAQDDASAFNPKNVKTETLSDGWALTFQNTGSAGDNYWVRVRRTIGGKAIACTTVADTADKQKADVAACKSLRG